MAIDHNKLFNPNSVTIMEDVSKIDEIIEFEEVLLSISERIIKYRKENNLTQKELANILKVNQSMVSKLESGDYNATFKNIYNISIKLEKSPAMFIEVLTDIINKIKKIKTNYYEIKSSDKEINYSYHTKKNGKLIEVEFYNKNGGIIDYGNYTSSISDVG